MRDLMDRYHQNPPPPITATSQDSSVLAMDGRRGDHFLKAGKDVQTQIYPGHILPKARRIATIMCRAVEAVR
jgi:hypothetical protein